MEKKGPLSWEQKAPGGVTIGKFPKGGGKSRKTSRKHSLGPGENCGL